MKIKYNRVIKCVTCLVTCFMLVVAGMTTPANAVVSDLDPADYVSGITVADGVKTVTYAFKGVSGLARFWDNGSSSAGGGVVDGLSYWLRDDATILVANYFPTGQNANEGNKLSNGRILVNEIIPGAPITLEFSIGVAYHALSDAVGSFTYYYSMVGKFYCYDKSGNYIGTVTGQTTKGTKLVDSSDVIDHEYEFAGEIPLNTYAVLPVVTFDITNLPGRQQFDITLVPNVLQLTVAIDSIVEQSHQITVIQDKLDSILSGTPEQNENANNSAGTVEDQKDQIGGLVDQLTPSRPNTDHIDTDINAIAGDEATALFSDGMSGILNHPLILSMLSIVAVVSFIGYVLFGKVG